MTSLANDPDSPVDVRPGKRQGSLNYFWNTAKTGPPVPTEMVSVAFVPGVPEGVLGDSAGAEEREQRHRDR